MIGTDKTFFILLIILVGAPFVFFKPNAAQPNAAFAQRVRAQDIRQNQQIDKWVSHPREQVAPLFFMPSVPSISVPSESLTPTTPKMEDGSLLLQQQPTITAEQIDAILAAANSPAVGTGALFMSGSADVARDLDIEPINPAIALAFFMHESSFATAKRWAGWKTDGTHTHNIGNIVCAKNGSPYWNGDCHGRFRDYSQMSEPWKQSIYDWYWLIGNEYIQGRGHRTIRDVIPVYAPAFENNVNGYMNAVDSTVVEWFNKFGKGD